ncbi:MAG: aminotransferase class I/II-fold pyridoxal phosphate-dependent enzyme, partial [Xanthomonadales bacterium]|nr:aminotransferase class I/II-fold pyridoxal phosphate-dependent enzyme [Xanthomonadales bacterium]
TALADMLKEHEQVSLVCDDIYEHIYWGQDALENMLQVAPQLRERTVLVNGVSKAYAMTGWRIGYAAGPAHVVTAMRKVQSQSTSNPCSISQAAAVAALNGPQDGIVAMTEAFRQRHDFVVHQLNAMDGVSCLPADGAFYALPSFEAVIERHPSAADDVELAGILLEEAEVALVPGTAFGIPGHLRLSYATSMDNLRAAMDRLADFVAGC